MEKEISIGDISGCLEVIENSEILDIEIEKIVMQWIEDLWNNSENGFDKKTVHKRGDNISPCYIEEVKKESGKLYRHMIKDNRFLWHKSQPKTYSSLLDACIKKEVFKVKCNICDNEYYTDLKSFKSIKWRICDGAKCITKTHEMIDYSKSRYDWEEDKGEMPDSNDDYMLAEGLEGNALTYYGKGEAGACLKIAYISDIHLSDNIWERKYVTCKISNDISQKEKMVINKLCDSRSGANLELFVGDISDNVNTTLSFFRQYYIRKNYLLFLNFKKDLEYYKNLKKDIAKCNAQNRIKKICKYIEVKKSILSRNFDMLALEMYKKKYYPNLNYEDTYQLFKQTKSYKQYKVNRSIEEEIKGILELFNIRDKYLSLAEKEEERKLYAKRKVEEWEKKYGKDIKKINVSDFQFSLYENVFFVLGNHDYISFSDVQSAVMFYKRELSNFGITVLQNECVIKEKYVIYGGTGFAKYDDNWNANTLVCCKNFNREDEIRETTAFEQGYKKALEYAKGNELCFICMSHYPISSCLNNVYDKETIYFTGHNHRNEYIKTSEKVLYADNQIGYDGNKRRLVFKQASTGYEVNPYHMLNDGLYPTTVEQYLKFYRYLGENIGQGTLLGQRCQNGELYLVKRRGYYGFFLLSAQKGSKGISIVNGGKTKKISESTEITWICQNFDTVVQKYIRALLPLRKTQEMISKELKELGLSGNIHGLIVDVDYFHHISFDPIKGGITFYYASSWGTMEEFDCFSSVIDSMESMALGCEKDRYNLIRKKYFEKIEEKGCLLNSFFNNNLIKTSKYDVKKQNQRIEKIIDRDMGMYHISRKIAPLQRLFSGRVLRDFDLKMTETKQKSYRKKMYVGRQFMCEGVSYQIVEDDGGDIIFARELKKRNGKIELSKKTTKFTLCSLKTKFQNKKEKDSYWIN